MQSDTTHLSNFYQNEKSLCHNQQEDKHQHNNQEKDRHNHHQRNQHQNQQNENQKKDGGRNRSRTKSSHSLLVPHYQQPLQRMCEEPQRSVAQCFTPNTSAIPEKTGNLKGIKCILKEELSSLEGVPYDPVVSGRLTMELSKSIKNRIKALHLERYRIISCVHIGTRNQQSMEIASKFLWDSTTDYHEKFVFEDSRSV